MEGSGVRRVLLVGSSFVVRFEREYVAGVRGWSQFNVDGCPVDFVGVCGVKVRNLRRLVMAKLTHYPRGYYSVCVVVVGSNDLCSSCRTPDAVARDLHSFASALVNEHGIEKVAVFQLLHRLKRNRHMEMLLSEYNKRIDLANERLQSCCADSMPTWLSVLFWAHDRRVLQGRSIQKDGTHLSRYGHTFFARSVIRCISGLVQPEGHIIRKKRTNKSNAKRKNKKRKNQRKRAKRAKTTE